MAKGVAFDNKVASFYSIFYNDLGSLDFSFFQIWAAL